MNNLSSSHIDKFKCVFSIEVEQLNMYSIEKNIHQDIINAGFKRFEGREFFNCKPNDIKYIFDKYDNNIIENNIIENNIIENNIIENNIIENNIIEKEKINKINLKKNRNMKYTCKWCKYETDFIANYNRHLTTKSHINNKNTKLFNCDNCDSSFSFASGL